MEKRHVVENWPKLSFASLKPTVETLQLWTQIVGKVRLANTPWLNHSWHVTLRLSARGLITPLIPHLAVGFTLEFDLFTSELVIRVTDGGERRLALEAQNIASFYDQVFEALDDLGVSTTIDAVPNELVDAMPFWEDTRPRVYDPEIARDLWRALVQVDRVLNRFRTCFLGKCSPVHLFWGGFDMAVTRFSGRRAPLHPGGIPHLSDAVTQEAYSHEVSSAGFWPGGGGVNEPCFYSYAYPAPEGFQSANVSPAAARFDLGLGEFLLPYEAVRAAPNPDAALTRFLQTTYEAAANLAGWDRATLECEEGQPSHPRQIG